MAQPDDKLCPVGIKESINAWVEYGRPTGGFLTAVLENDLKESIGRADIFNLQALPHIVAYLYNCAPFPCWGSPEKVASWAARFKRSAQD